MDTYRQGDSLHASETKITHPSKGGLGAEVGRSPGGYLKVIPQEKEVPSKALSSRASTFSCQKAFKVTVAKVASCISWEMK